LQHTLQDGLRSEIQSTEWPGGSFNGRTAPGYPSRLISKKRAPDKVRRWEPGAGDHKAEGRSQMRSRCSGDVLWLIVAASVFYLTGSLPGSGTGAWLVSGQFRPRPGSVTGGRVAGHRTNDTYKQGIGMAGLAP